MGILLQVGAWIQKSPPPKRKKIFATLYVEGDDDTVGKNITGIQLAAPPELCRVVYKIVQKWGSNSHFLGIDSVVDQVKGCVLFNCVQAKWMTPFFLWKFSPYLQTIGMMDANFWWLCIFLSTLTFPFYYCGFNIKEIGKNEFRSGLDYIGLLIWIWICKNQWQWWTKFCSDCRKLVPSIARRGWFRSEFCSHFDPCGHGSLLRVVLMWSWICGS